MASSANNTDTIDNPVAKKLMDALHSAGLEAKYEDGLGDCTDDSAELEEETANGLEISVQIVNEESPRGQKNYCIGFWSAKKGTMYHGPETNNVDDVVNTIKAAIKDGYATC